jgi:hypothetical protein
MNTVICVAAQQWLRTMIQIGHPNRPPPVLQTHMAACATCQGALLLLVTQALNVPSVPATIECERCLDDLPAFIEQEIEDPVQAMRTYSHIWWHTLTCPTCAETYELTHILVDAEQRGEIATPMLTEGITAISPQFQTLLKLTRQFLNVVLPSPTLIGALRGHNSEPMVLSQGNDTEGRQFILSVQEQSDHGWSVVVAVMPPPCGWLVLTLGTAVFRGRFDEQGKAAVTDVPTALLAVADGPDLVVGIEADGNSKL